MVCCGFYLFKLVCILFQYVLRDSGVLPCLKVPGKTEINMKSLFHNVIMMKACRNVAVVHSQNTLRCSVLSFRDLGAV